MRRSWRSRRLLCCRRTVAAATVAAWVGETEGISTTKETWSRRRRRLRLVSWHSFVEYHKKNSSAMIQLAARWKRFYPKLNPSRSWWLNPDTRRRRREPAAALVDPAKAGSFACRNHTKNPAENSRSSY